MNRRNDTQIMGDQIRFPATNWNLVRSSRHLQALESIVAIYWKPLYFFVRQRGFDNETSKDIVQGFLTALLERDSFRKADPRRGRFRSFLLASLVNFIKDWVKAESCEKRGGDHAIFSLDFKQGESEYCREVAAGERPEVLLNRIWARSLWNHSIEELHGDPAHLEAFRLYLNDGDYAAICRSTGLTESAAKTAVHRLKGKLKEIVTDHLRRTAANEDDLQRELSEFIDLLS